MYARVNIFKICMFLFSRRMASGTSKGSVRGSLSEPRKKHPFQFQQFVDDDYFGIATRSLDSRPNNWVSSK